MKSKTIILSNEKDKGRGILTIYQEDGLLQCRLRLYNIEKLNRFCKLGIYHENQVFSANLLEKNGVYTSSMVGDFDIDKDFYSAIIDTQKNNNVIISGGTYAGFFFNDESVFENNFPNNDVFNQVEKENPNTNLFDYDNNDNCSYDNNCDYDYDHDYDYNQNTSPHNNVIPSECNESSVSQEKRFLHSFHSFGRNDNPQTDESTPLNITKDEQTIKESELQASCELESKRLNRACLGNSGIDLQGSQRSKQSASHGKEEQPLENEVCELESKRLNRACCDECIYKKFFYTQNNDSLDYDCNQDKDLSTPLRRTDNSLNMTKDEQQQTNTFKNNKNHLGDVPSGEKFDCSHDLADALSEQQQTNTLVEALIPQFQYVFENYPQDEVLNALIPNSKFVKIEENNSSYSIGAIYNEEKMKYICYATMCDYNTPAPQELGEHYQWLPLDKDDPLSEGYYIVFQDAQDLKIVKF